MAEFLEKKISTGIKSNGSYALEEEITSNDIVWI